MARGTRVILFHGNVGAMPSLALGEPAFCVDTGQLFIGNGVASIPIGGARLPPGNYVDITVSLDGLTWTINPHVVDASKMAQIATSRLLGRVTAGTGDVEVITIAQAMGFANNFIALGKLAQMNPFQLLGRNTAGIGDVEAVTMAQALNFLGFGQGEILYANVTGWTRLSPGPVLCALELTTVGAGVEPRWKAKGLAYVADQKASGTGGGASATGGFNTRTLNTVVYDRSGIVSLATNQVTLPAGDYHLRARAPALGVGTHQVRLRNITSGTTVGTGSSAYTNNVNVSMSDSWVDAYVSNAGSAAYELQHATQLAVATFGYGAAANNGTEVYGEMWIERLA